MRLNQPAKFTETTHEGGPAWPVNVKQALRRSVLSCLLFEKEFYEDGEDIARRIENLVGQSKPEDVATLALEARSVFNLRHVPLLLMARLAQIGKLKAADLTAVIQRADEPGEFLSIFWRGLKAPIPSQVKRGLASAFAKFDEYQLAKYDRDSKIKLRDVMRLVHPNPDGAERSALYKGVIDRSLPPPSTWEVAISAVGKDSAKRKAIWEGLLTERKLGYLALLRNLRNMVGDGVDKQMISVALLERKGAHRVLPFRYIAAARAVPQLEPVIDQALLASIADAKSLPGSTVVLVDVSGSMEEKLSAKSDLTRVDAAAALASIIPAENLEVFTFSDQLVACPPRKGMAGVDSIIHSQPHSGTRLGEAVSWINSNITSLDRLIVITDEQTSDYVPQPMATRSYLINVASARNGVGYGRWTHIDGFSESVIRFIAESEFQPAD